MAKGDAVYLVNAAAQAAQSALTNAQNQSDKVLTTAMDALRRLGYGDSIGAGHLSIDMKIPSAPVLEPPKMASAYQIMAPTFGAEPSIGTAMPPTPVVSLATKAVKPNNLDIVIPQFSVKTQLSGMPALSTFDIPDQPEIVIPPYPELVEIQISGFSESAPEYDPSIGNIDFLMSVPNIVPYVEPDSGIAAAVMSRRDWLIERIQNGGTGLPTDVENSIWERERDRESGLMVAAEREAMTQDAAMGFALPSGALQAKISKVRMDYAGKMISIGRDMAIKQAQIEIDNINKSLELLNQLEGKLIDDDIERKRTTLEACKYATQGAIQIYEATIKGYMSMLDAKKIASQVYQAMMDGYRARVDAYRAVIDAEKTKSEVNQSVISAFEAQINVEKTRVDMYRANVDALVSMTRLEEFKIRKYEAEIGAFTSEVNAYAAEIGGKKAEAEVYGEKVRAYQAEVGAYSAEIQAENLQYSAQIESYKQSIQADLARMEAYKARIQAEGLKVQADGQYATALTEAARTYSAAVGSYNSVLSGQWAAATQAEISAQSLAANVQKMNNDSVHQAITANNGRSTAMSQVYAQLAGSAMNMASAHVNLNAAGNAQTSESWSYQGKA